MLTRLQGYLKGSGLEEDDVVGSESEEEIRETPSSTDMAIESLTRGFQRLVGAEVINPQKPLFEKPVDFLELYAGCGNMSKAWVAEGFFGFTPYGKLKMVGTSKTRNCFGDWWPFLELGNLGFCGGHPLVRVSLWLGPPNWDPWKFLGALIYWMMRC